MFLVIGELRKIIDEDYKDKSGQVVRQSILIFEPPTGRQNVEVFLNGQQIESLKDWQALRGKTAAIMANIYVNHDYRFYKLNAVGNAKPQPVPTIQ